MKNLARTSTFSGGETLNQYLKNEAKTNVVEVMNRSKVLDGVIPAIFWPYRFDNSIIDGTYRRQFLLMDRYGIAAPERNLCC
jgi:hypothetical protein